MDIFDTDAGIKSLYYFVCGVVLVASIGAYAVQWFMSRRLVSGHSFAEDLTVWRVWSLRTARSAFYGAGFMFLATPVGYYFVDGLHGLSDSLSFSMPCLAGIVAGLALLMRQYPMPKSKTAGQVGPQPFHQAVEGVDPCETASAVKSNAADDVGSGGEERLLELRYYIISVIIIIIGYISYIGAHPSDAIRLFAILCAGWFILGWLVFIWAGRIKNSSSGDFFGFILILVLAFVLFGLSSTVYRRWGTYLPAAGCHRENEDCHIDHGSYKKAENHVVFSAPFS